MSAIAKEQQRMRAQLDELDQARDKLTQEREQIDAELAGVEVERGKVEFALEVLARVDAESSPSERRPHRGRLVPTGRRVEGGSADYALRALVALGRPSTAEEVVEQMRVIGWDAAAVKRPVEVVRNALIRAIAAGEVRKTERGQYIAVSVDDQGQDTGQGAEQDRDEHRAVEPASTVSAFGVDHGEPAAMVPSVFA